MLYGDEYVVITKYTEDERERTRLDYYKKKEDAFKAKESIVNSNIFREVISIGVYQTAFVPVEE